MLCAIRSGYSLGIVGYVDDLCRVACTKGSYQDSLGYFGGLSFRLVNSRDTVSRNEFDDFGARRWWPIDAPPSQLLLGRGLASCSLVSDVALEGNKGGFSDCRLHMSMDGATVDI